MKFSTLAERMPALLQAGISIELISAPGRGKSDFVKELPKVMTKAMNVQWGYAEMFLATQTPPDLTGFQFKAERSFPNEDGSSRTVSVSDPSMPIWMVTADRKHLVTDFQYGILFLDEYGQGEADVKRASAELLLNKKIGPWSLPKGWVVIAASNRATDRSGVTKSFDFVINRRLQIEISDDLESWEDWAFAHGIDPLIISFTAANPQTVFADGVPSQQGPWCTPRSIVMAGNVLGFMRQADGKLPTDAAAVELASGLIGGAAAAQLFTHIRLGHEMPPFDEIVAAPTTTKVPAKPDAQMLVAYELAARVSTPTAGPVLAYIDRLPKDFAITFCKSVIRRDRKMVVDPHFVKWMGQNQQLIAIVMGSQK